jgi:hypothetical protein
MGRPAGKKEGRWRKQRMKVSLTRIDQVWIIFYWCSWEK